MIVWIICKGGRQLKKLLYGLALPFLLIHTAPLIAGNFTVTGVYDGETVRAKGYGVEIVVRLARIQTPDLLQEEGPAHRLAMEEKSQLAEWTLERKVKIEGHGLDEFNCRTLNLPGRFRLFVAVVGRRSFFSTKDLDQ
jgi:endonuclease YncB( thermonuclease family)